MLRPIKTFVLAITDKADIYNSYEEELGSLLLKDIGVSTTLQKFSLDINKQSGPKLQQAFLDLQIKNKRFEDKETLMTPLF